MSDFHVLFTFNNVWTVKIGRQKGLKVMYSICKLMTNLILYQPCYLQLLVYHCKARDWRKWFIHLLTQWCRSDIDFIHYYRVLYSAEKPFAATDRLKGSGDRQPTSNTSEMGHLLTKLGTTLLLILIRTLYYRLALQE